MHSSGTIYVADTSNNRIQAGWRPTPALANAPAPLTNQTHFSLIVGGQTVTQYRYRLDGRAWSAVAPIATPISLTLDNGHHILTLLGGGEQGSWQELAAVHAIGWTVDSLAPDAPAIPADRNPAVWKTAQPTLVWTEVPSAPAYNVEVADNAAFTNPLVQISQTGDTSHTLTTAEALTHQGTWHWRVQARDTPAI